MGARARRARVRRHRVPAEHGLRAAAADRLRHRGRPASADRGTAPPQAATGRRDRAHPGGRPQHARLKRVARPLPAVLGDRAGAARRLPRGRGELQEAGQAAAGEDRRLARRQGRAARRRAWQPRVDRGLRPGQVVPGVLRLPALSSAAGGAVRPARQRARADRDRRERPPAAAHPLRLAGRRRAHPDDGQAAFRAAAEVPRRPGLVREPPGDRHPARHRVPRPPAPRIRKYPDLDRNRHRHACHQAADGAPAVRPGQQAPHRQHQCKAGRRGEETDPAKLFEQVYVDPGPLRGGVRQALRRTPQVGLAEVIARTPLTQGLAELVTYLSLKDEAFAIVYDNRHTEQVSWTEPDGRARTATLPRVTFTRTGSTAR